MALPSVLKEQHFLFHNPTGTLARTTFLLAAALPDPHGVGLRQDGKPACVGAHARQLDGGAERACAR